MPIVYEGFGNILTNKAQTIVCPVNTVGVMGAGLALAMRNRIQGLHHFYKNLCAEGLLSPGLCKIYPIPKSNQNVLLFPSKLHWKDDSDIGDIVLGLEFISKNYKELGITELAITPVGCGLGRLDYTKDVKELMFKYLEPMDIPVQILHREIA